MQGRGRDSVGMIEVAKIMALQSIVIGRDAAQRIEIEPIGCADDGCLIAQVSVSCGVWSGLFACEFLEGALGRFAVQLEEVYEGLGVTATLEAALGRLKLSVLASPKITVEGLAAPGHYTGTYLTFTLLLDRQELPDIIEALLVADQDPRYSRA
jgi:hypothetical protein